ncbi:MAG: imidazoleglycerol-phosphate dehydratase [Candidatus Omnitrophica bacterium]|nr:imidazoleglycerol-phosphate dehydratase [Candidatus Omnitrophota bacterium]
MKKRIAVARRKTKETDIVVKLTLGGAGKTMVKSGIGLLDHMLELFAFHGMFNLDITAKGDLDVDLHHTNEDVGIVLGEAFKKALGDKKGIRRFGFSSVPMEEVVASVTVDISGRGYFKFSTGETDIAPETQDSYSLQDAQHFFEAFAKHLGMNLNISVNPLSRSLHTTLEPVFKALGLALDQATQIDPRRKGVPSTKGIID